jgi:hypothetical protein
VRIDDTLRCLAAEDGRPAHARDAREEALALAVGLARVVSAAPRLALAVGYDLDGALEGRPTEG